MRCVLLLCLLLFAPTAFVRAEESLRIALFNVDATPPIGSPVAYASTRKILDPLSARGVVILGADKPIVLCAVDWIGIANGGHDAWREKLAAAAGTTADHVAVHALHQHDGVRCDFTAEMLLAQHGAGGKKYDLVFCRETIEKTAEAIEAAVKKSQPMTHLGLGKAKVEKVASNRRILGDDGKVKIVRYSKSRDPAAIAAPEGVIDPYLRLVSFWNEDKPIVCMTYYATHPQSYYGQGDVTSEFVGIARSMREEAVPGVMHVHFNGASGNVAAGKYNDGSKEMRPVLAGRMEKGMRLAWEAVEKKPVSAKDLEWRVAKVKLPPGKHIATEAMKKTLADKDADIRDRLTAAKHLGFAARCSAGNEIEISALRFGDASIIHMPGELFIEYQLAAQKLAPKNFVAMAAYGDYGPGYIGTEIAYSQGGYETSQRASRVAPQVEGVLMKAMQELLK